MELHRFKLTYYINNTIDKDTILKSLHDKHHIQSTEYPEYNMVILYNKYDKKNKTPLEMECRSVILDKTTNSIICYSCPTPLYNIDASNYMMLYQYCPSETYVCYEGSLLSLFNYEGVWYIGTRKCIYNTSGENASPHYKMFMDVLKKDGYSDLNSFTQYLDVNQSYHFILIHYLNENIVNYTKEFEEQYMKLCFIYTRNITTQIETRSEDIDTTIISDNIFLPKKINTVVNYNDYYNDSILKLDINNAPTDEGILIKINETILKIQSPSYLFHKAIGIDKNMYRGLITLYQNNLLKLYFDTHTNGNKFRKIVNPINTKESYDIIGTIDALFKVCASELYYLFNIIWDSNGNHLNNALYSILPKEYKNILYSIRGYFIKNKKKLIWPHQDEDILSFKHIYNILKYTDIKVFESFIRCRKLMLNWVNVSHSNELLLFSSTLHKIQNIYYKLSSILTIILFPNIMPTDIPIEIVHEPITQYVTPQIEDVD